MNNLFLIFSILFNHFIAIYVQQIRIERNFFGLETNKTYFENLHKNKKHPVHVTVCNIEYVDAEKEFNISFKIFADDFEKIVKQKYNIDLNLGKNNESKDCVSYINLYVFEHFSLFVNDIEKSGKKLIFDKFEIKDLAVWIFYKFKIKNEIKNVKIINSLMTDMYFDQKNLLIFSYKTEEKAFTFDNKTIEEKFELE